MRRLRNPEKCLRACQGLDPHVIVTGPESVDPATLARLVSTAARRPLGLGAGLRSANWTTASSLLAGLADGGVLFLDGSSPGRGPGDDVPEDYARRLSIPLRGALLEGLANGSLTREVSDGVTQRDITLRLPWFVVVVVSSNEAEGFDPGAEADGGAERRRSTAERLAAEPFAFDLHAGQPLWAAWRTEASPGCEPSTGRSSPFAPGGGVRRGPCLGVVGRESRHIAARGVQRSAARGGPGAARGGGARTGLPNVRHGAPNVRRSGPSMLWPP